MKKTFNIQAVAVLLLIGGAISAATAQNTSESFIVSWKTEAYAPDSFTGKVLPTERTMINIAFEILRNGKLVDLSSKKIRWFVNDSIVSDKTGENSLSLPARGHIGTSVAVRIAIIGVGEPTRIHEFSIPIVPPEVVIQPLTHPTERTLVFEALPFSFNIKSVGELSFDWSANGIKALGSPNSPERLVVELPEESPAGGSLALDLVTIGNTMLRESASTKLYYVLK